MASTNISLRLASRLPNTSASDSRPPGEMPKMKRPSSRWSSMAMLAAVGRGMRVGHVDGAGAELDALGGVDQRGDEHDARGDVLGLVGDVLADVALHEAELVGQDERLAVLPERHPPILLERMDRHGEEAELHGWSLLLDVLLLDGLGIDGRAGAAGNDQRGRRRRRTRRPCPWRSPRPAPSGRTSRPCRGPWPGSPPSARAG